MNRQSRWAFFWGALLLSRSAAGAPEARMRLPGTVSAETARATHLSDAASEETVSVALVIKLDQDLLDRTVREIYAQPAGQRHFMTSQAFAQQFELATKQKKLRDFAQTNSWSLQDTDPNDMVVHASASVHAIEKTLNVHLSYFRGADGQRFRAHDREPSVPAELGPHLNAILGLSNRTGVRHAHVRIRRLSAHPGVQNFSTFSAAVIAGATGPQGGLAPADIKTIYHFNGLSQTGTGQTAAVYEFDGYNPTDIASYESNFGLPTTPLTFIGVDGTKNLCGASQNQTCNSQTAQQDSDMTEVALDIEMITALAPGVSSLYVYDGPNTEQGSIDIYNKIAADDLAKSVSTSWGAPELEMGSAVLQAENQIFQRMAIQGQTIFAAAGDNGAFDTGSANSSVCNGVSQLCVDDPASQPYVTGAGGTSLSGSLASPSERVWNDANGASGGGVSALWPLPDYQSGVQGSASQQSRNVPDVSVNADPQSGYSIYVGGTWTVVGGTSAAAPLWAAYAALLNQQSTQSGSALLGFANPSIYRVGTNSVYASNFNDITSGSNGHYSAGIGYDNCTGWGSFVGNMLLNALASVPRVTSLSPASTAVEGPALTLTIRGTNFVTTSSVTWNGTLRDTTYVNPQQLTIQVSAADIATLSSNQISVINTTTAGTFSAPSALAFNVTYPDDVLALSNVFAYPNPWDVRRAHTREMSFANLPDGATLKIFTVSGRQIKSLTASHLKATWDLTTDHGELAASGLYFFVANFSGHQATGKFAIIR